MRDLTAALVAHFAILVGIELWPEKEHTVCCCVYISLLGFYALCIALHFVRKMRRERLRRALCSVDLRQDLPHFVEFLYE